MSSPPPDRPKSGKPRPNSRTTSFKIGDGLNARLDEQAEILGCTRTEVIERALSEFLDRQETLQAQRNLTTMLKTLIELLKSKPEQ